MSDARTQRTDNAIKSAFLELLEEKPLCSISMAELAKLSGISRSTLYAHFGNVIDVFNSLVKDFLRDIIGLRALLRCEECGKPESKKPFCLALRAAGPYQPLVMAPEFMPTFMDCVLEESAGFDALEPYRLPGLTESQAKTLFTFQMNGCYAAAMLGKEVVWSDHQKAIDRFIRGGLAALQTASGKQ